PLFLTQPSEALIKKYRSLEEVQIQRLNAGGQDSKSEWSYSVGLDHERNRYTNIVPYDKSRIRLSVAPGFDDYINASYVALDLKEYSLRRGNYIATQGPTENTTSHFWQMCYNSVKSNNVVIVMVTPLVEKRINKCHKYWPDSGTLDLPNLDGFNQSLKIEFLSSEKIDDSFLLTNLKIIPDDPQLPVKQVYHLYYDQWKDFHKPTSIDPIILLNKYAESYLADPNDPMIVHCSAGVGRSGTFITLSYLLSCSKTFVLG
ncbi:hypothetical protein PACTADRAFT_27762, partial [Pachysolen tannophilus NRRL Y-2460]